MNSTSIFVVLMLFLALSDTNESRVIEKLSNIIVTEAGPIQGVKEVSFSGRPVDAYYGVPYAKPPVGQLRFAPPVKHPQWNDTLQADQEPCPCYQNIKPKFGKAIVRLKMMVERPWCEDCLKLNLWVPENVGDGPKSVLVTFHLGGFQSGSSVHYYSNGATTAVEADIIVVTVNFRLNVFGFLRLPTAETPGNVGLLDQRLALEWVRDNIDSFGGDPNSVTLYGLGSGATSAGLHLLSPSSRGLFKRAVMLGSVSNDFWSVREESHIVYKSVVHAQTVNCTGNDFEFVVECLRNLTAEEISAGLSDYPKINYSPIVDGTFLPAKPSLILKFGRFNDADLIVGSRSAESDPFLNLYSVNLTNTIKYLQQLMPDVSLKEFEVISAFYIDQNAEDSEIQVQVARMINDIRDICADNEFARRYTSSRNKVYRFIFDQPELVRFGSGSELFGGYPLVNELSNSDSDPSFHLKAQLSRRMMRYLGNFARTGDPNAEDEFEPKWPRYTASNREHLFLGFNSSIGAAYRTRECAFFREIVPRIRSLRESCNAQNVSQTE